MSAALLQNRAGKWVACDAGYRRGCRGVQTAVNAENFSIVDASGANSYPISGYSWVVVYKKPADAAPRQGPPRPALRGWWANRRNPWPESVDYVPLPSTFRTRPRRRSRRCTSDRTTNYGRAGDVVPARYLPLRSRWTRVSCAGARTARGDRMRSFSLSCYGGSALFSLLIVAALFVDAHDGLVAVDADFGLKFLCGRARGIRSTIRSGRCR